MTQDEIIEMAKQSGLLDMDYELGDWEIYEFTTFAKLVAAKERDQCCSIIYGQCGSDNVAERTVKAIQARGEA